MGFIDYLSQKGKDVVDNVINSHTGSTSAANSNQTKQGYDTYRAAVWQNFATLVDAVTIARGQGLVDRAGLQMYIDAIARIANDFKVYTDSVSSKIGSSWVNPRFHDYYDFMNKVLNDYRNEIITLPATSWLDDLTGSTTMPKPPTLPATGSSVPILTGSVAPPAGASLANLFSGNTLLVLGLAVGAVIFLGHKQR